ncbi:MAG: hypothetical protein IJ723_05020 [Ruminococcus sp.]|nr:hypothetical protein [Ruminococcus sp.]
METQLTNTTIENPGGLSDYDIIKEHGDAVKKKSEMKTTMTGVIAAILAFAVFLVSLALKSAFGAFLFIPIFIVMLIPGWFLSELLLNMLYGKNPGTSGAEIRKIKFVFGESAIRLQNDGQIEKYIYYRDIDRVTRTGFDYYIVSKGEIYRLSKKGFDPGEQEFEELMSSKGISIDLK